MSNQLNSALPYLIKAVEEAAISAAEVAGSGNKTKSDQAATEAMRQVLNQSPVKIKVVIGEGERDQAPMLYIGEELGGRSSRGSKESLVIAVDPLENTNASAKDTLNAITVLAAASEGGLLGAPDIYMEKFVVGSEAAGAIKLDEPVVSNLERIAKKKAKNVTELKVVILDRERHAALIKSVRQAGARIRLIADGDVLGAISALVPDSGVDALIGTGAAPEGVIAAAAVRCLGGQMQARFVTNIEEETGQTVKAGQFETGKVYGEKELAPGEDLVVVFTGVTGGQFIDRVRFQPSAVQTETILLSTGPKVGNNIRKIKSYHLRQNGEALPFLS